PLIRQVGMDTDDLGAQHEYGLELSRSFRALKVWSVLSHVGVEGFRDTISRQNAMAADLADYVEQSDDLELLAPPVLSVVCFRYVPPALHADEERLNALNKDIVVKLQAEGRVYPSSTELEGRFTIRANIFHYAADRSDVDTLIEDVRRYGGELMQGSTP
ncbi:MAG: pyridoxal-dependent decarboxylase, partial [Gammaproteobacteria bacterium]|nr:pyridoxal-dependent decarboxylase [Gammaproteobacteria bacterium]